MVNNNNNNNNNDDDGDKVEGWNTLVDQIGSLVVFDPPGSDWGSEVGKIARKELEILLVGSLVC
jgi:hypothetical protein